MPETETQPKETRLMKAAPAIFWGTMIALPALNLTAAIFNYKSVQLEYATELLKHAEK